MNKCKKCGSNRHTVEEKSCCNCKSFTVPNERCGEGTYTTREGYCTQWKQMKKTLLELVEIRGSIEHLLEHGNWFGPTDILEKALIKVNRQINAKKKRCTAHGQRS